MKEMTEAMREWRDENMEAIREGVKAVKEGRITPAYTFFEWMQAKYVRDIWEARIADLERQLEEALGAWREFPRPVFVNDELQPWLTAYNIWLETHGTALARILKECACDGPPLQPCGPKCRYPYTDVPKEE